MPTRRTPTWPKPACPTLPTPFCSPTVVSAWLPSRTPISSLPTSNNNQPNSLPAPSSHLSSIPPFFYRSIHMLFHPWVLPSVRLPSHLCTAACFVDMFVHPISILLPTRPSKRQSVCPFTNPSIRLPACLSNHPSVCSSTCSLASSCGCNHPTIHLSDVWRLPTCSHIRPYVCKIAYLLTHLLARMPSCLPSRTSNIQPSHPMPTHMLPAICPFTQFTPFRLPIPPIRLSVQKSVRPSYQPA